MTSIIQSAFFPQEIIPNLFQSGFIISPSLLARCDFNLVIDLEGGFDRGSLAKLVTAYIYWPIADGPLPDIQTLQQISLIGSFFINRKMRVLVHCFFGMNRSSLITGMIMWRLGYKGDQIVNAIKHKIPLSLTNEVFLNYLLAL